MNNTEKIKQEYKGNYRDVQKIGICWFETPPCDSTFHLPHPHLLWEQPQNWDQRCCCVSKAQKILVFGCTGSAQPRWRIFCSGRSRAVSLERFLRPHSRLQSRGTWRPGQLGSGWKADPASRKTLLGGGDSPASAAGLGDTTTEGSEAREQLRGRNPRSCPTQPRRGWRKGFGTGRELGNGMGSSSRAGPVPEPPFTPRMEQFLHILGTSSHLGRIPGKDRARSTPGYGRGPFSRDWINLEVLPPRTIP